MSSNYPPGVTGREYQIAGADFERDEQRTCGKRDVEILLPVDDVQFRVDMALGLLTGRVYTRDGTDAPARAAQHLQAALKAYEDGDKTEVAVCPFSGEVTVQGYNGVLSWTCPLCESEHEEDLRDD